MSVRVTRTSQASWPSDLTDGGGRIGAAHAGCLTMSLEARLAGE